MGIKERREREKYITRQAILAAALEIARQDGWSALTIRKVGEHIEYSAPMVYEYFKNKEDMLLELLQDGFRQLTASMQQASISTADDEERRLLEIADAYWQFAMNNPELYQLMHGLAGVSLDKTVIAQAVQASCTVAQEAIVDWAEEHNVAISDPLGATEIIWSLLHGLVSLTLVDRVEKGKERARNMMHHAIQSQLAGWKVS
ncbi:TetR family transcriptional regulator [Dictyobacter sp. S3.2.2.5]|uniref:TetR family transcriptional regulator n=1 Tax=Dictyobacter halimunensis TaxID=3026934 RepID=A0ABQ6FM53_9CHLR|nr:TetR family transcriptional regulator [Dictyobacter sp. S3.2.2.5]